MAIAFGADLGFAASPDTSSATTVVLTTTAAVPAGGKLTLGLGWYNAATFTVAGGGLTWTSDANVAATGTPDRQAGLASADAPAGLAISTALTVTWNTAVYSRLVAASYFTGLATASYFDGSIKGDYDGNATWETGTLNTTNADDLLFAACWADGSSGATSSPTAPFAEINDNYAAGADNSLTTIYRIVSATGGYVASGTWSLDREWQAVVGAYKASTAVDTGLAWIKA